MNPVDVSGFFTLSLRAVGNVIDTTTSINHKIPADQYIRLRGYRVEMDTQENALATKVLHIDVPWLSSTQIISNVLGQPTIPISLDNAIVTLQNSLNKPILVTRGIEEKFKVRVLSSDYSLNANVVAVDLDFETEQSAIR